MLTPLGYKNCKKVHMVTVSNEAFTKTKENPLRVNQVGGVTPPTACRGRATCRLPLDLLAPFIS